VNGVTVIEAVEWRDEALDGGSQAQVFRLSDERFAVVKFPENGQGEKVLANEFLSCQLAETLNLPVNRAVMVSIDERLLRTPRQNSRIPAAFSAGIRCGMIRFANAEKVQDGALINAQCGNAAELHALAVFEQLVLRGDGRQLLWYPADGGKRFAAYDYGFAFGGQPNWSAASLPGLAAPTLPATDPLTGGNYANGGSLEPFIKQLRALVAEVVTTAVMKLQPPRWGVVLDDVQALVPVLVGRAAGLVQQFDQKYPKEQMEVLPDV